MTFEVKKSTQFKINELVVVTKAGNIDISGIYEEIKIFDSKIETYFELNNLKNPSIYSIDIIEDFDSNIFFLEINLRPGALYRFSYLLSVPVS